MFFVNKTIVKIEHDSKEKSERPRAESQAFSIREVSRVINESDDLQYRLDLETRAKLEALQASSRRAAAAISRLQRRTLVPSIDTSKS